MLSNCVSSSLKLNARVVISSDGRLTADEVEPYCGRRNVVSPRDVTEEAGEDA